MATTLTDIQTLARDYARFDGYTITSGTNLVRANQIYRKIQTLHLWPELHTTDTSLALVKKKETYSWLLTTVFLKEPLVRIQNPNGRFTPVDSVPTESLWAELSRVPNTTPRYYRRSAASDVLKISFRPVPDFAGTIEVSGYASPNALNGAGSKTVFENDVVDDAFAIWLAAIESDKKGFAGRAATLFGQAASLLSAVTGLNIGAGDLGLNLPA